MKTIKRITFVAAIFSVIYIAGCILLPQTRYSYRMWTDAAGKLISIYLLPFLILLMAGIWLWKRQRIPAVLKVIVSLVAAAVYVFFGFWIFIFLLFTVQEEKKLTRHLLVVNEAEFLDASCYEYYYPAAFLFREPGELTEEIKAEYLEEKYGVYAEVFSGFDIQVRRNGMNLEENFVESVTAYLLESAIKAQGVERDFYREEKYTGMPGWLYLELKNEGDIEKMASAASGLIRYVLAETDFFETNRGVLCFYCGEGETQVTGNIPFGKLSQWDELEPEYYLDEKLVAERIRQEYEEAVQFREEYEQAVQLQEKHEERIPETAEDEMSVETAAELIYKDVLEQKGYSCTPDYNAKGNFYLDLGMHPTELASDSGSSGYDRYTLVYDRKSRNGACELFVFYKEHYAEDSEGNKNLTNTAILDMYAVETETERVIASGRKTWSDVGTAEYREAVGE